MKEIKYGEVTLTEYDNEQIYKNFGFMVILCGIACVLSLATIVLFTVSTYLRHDWNGELIFMYVVFYAFLVLAPLYTLTRSIVYSRKPSEYSKAHIAQLQKAQAREKALQNKKSLFLRTPKVHAGFSSSRTVLTFISVEIVKVVLLAFYALIGKTYGFSMKTSFGMFGQCLVWMLPSSLLVYIAAGVLVNTCALIKAEHNGTIPPANTADKNYEHDRFDDEPAHEVAPEHAEHDRFDDELTEETTDPAPVAPKNENAAIDTAALRLVRSLGGDDPKSESDK